MKSKELTQLWNKVLNVNEFNYFQVLDEVTSNDRIEQSELAEMIKQLTKFYDLFMMN